MKRSSLNMLLVAASMTLAACGGSAPEPAAEAPDVAAGGMLATAPLMQGDTVATNRGDVVIRPLAHATFAMAWDGKTIYVDPVGGAEVFSGLPSPDLILITDVHGDHLNAETVEAVATASTEIVAPAAVIEELPEALASRARALANGEETSLLDLQVEAVPMYNLTEERLQYHERGRGNGYVVTLGGTRVYISGDTEDIPEMRALENIDVAFVCFNLPFTMTEQQAASAVLEFEPGIVYPYHYRGSDLDAFVNLVTEGNSAIEVRRGEWY